MTLIPSDGIGPEVVEATRRVVEATGVAIEWDRQEIAGAFARTGRRWRRRARSAAPGSRGGRWRPRDERTAERERVTLRQDLDLYACVRPCRRYPGVPSVYGDVDLIVVRENTEGMYTGIEFAMEEPDTKELLRFIETASAGGSARTAASRSRRSAGRGASGSSGTRSSSRVCGAAAGSRRATRRTS
ncbi:MAG: isocitrate/isopropylmalate family dehydrogenase [Actinomycetota bacterium]